MAHRTIGDDFGSYEKRIDRVDTGPDEREVQRRRDLIGTLFNDFWSAVDDKPSSFVDRLDQAETYINERLTACGEFWRLNVETRETLGLPPNQAIGRSRR